MGRYFVMILCWACGASGPQGIASPAPAEPVAADQAAGEQIAIERGTAHARAEEPRAETLTLTGPCVVPEEREYMIDVDARRAGSEPQRRAVRTLHMDVDGDGDPDALVPTLQPGRCSHETEYAIFVMRGECGYHVGRVTGQVSFLTSSDETPPGRLRALVSTRRWAEITDRTQPAGPDNVATLHTVTTPWTARNDRYVPGASDVSEGICHHCAMTTCRTLSGPPAVDASCDPLPREDQICEGYGYCLVTWGQPGGHSSALWCHNGRWRIENESNLP